MIKLLLAGCFSLGVALSAAAAPVQTVLHAPRSDEGARKSPHVGIP